VYNYGLIKSGDYEAASKVYEEISNLDLLDLNNITYNLFFNNEFINSQFKTLYRLIDSVEEGVLLIDKSMKFLKFDDIIKIIYHIKMKLLNPLTTSLERGDSLYIDEESDLLQENEIIKQNESKEEYNNEFI
jgi:hypothetical protein